MENRRLSEKKRMLLEARLSRKISTGRSNDSGIGRRPDESKALASPGQSRIWLLHQVDEKSAGYNITSSFRIASEVNREALEWSLNRIADRHEILKCAYRLIGADIEQIANPSLEYEVENPHFESEASMMESVEAFARVPFDIENDRLLRLRLFSRGNHSHVLILVVHDMIFDKWSLILFWKEFGFFYSQRTRGHGDGLPALTVQFSDFAYWQRNWLNSGEGKKQIDYWKERLANPPLPIALKTNFPYSDTISDRGKLERHSISVATTEKLRALAIGEECSLFMVLILGFDLLLRRYSDSEDILIASPVANRRKKETAELIGFFLNTITLRLGVDERLTVSEALREAKQIALEALENQDVPLDAVVEAVKPVRVRGRMPLIQTMFVFQREDEGVPKLALEGCDVTPIYVETLASKFDLSLFVAESGEGMDTIVEFRTDLFEADTIRGFLTHYSEIIDSLVANPSRPLSELEMLPIEDRRALSRFETSDRIEHGEEGSILRAIIDQSRERSQSIALRYGGSELTYEELDKRSSLIARTIVESNQDLENPIGLYLKKSPLAICGILGVLKAGGAYLSIDPDYPDERVRFMANDSGTRLILTSSETDTKRLPSTIDVLELESIDFASDIGEAFSFPDPIGSKAAYVIYTSGSSGSPKGVLVSHRNLMHSTAARMRYYESDPQRFLLISSLSFDSSVAGLFWTLATGGEIVIPSADELRNPDRLCQLIRRESVSTFLCVPSFYEQILDWDAAALSSIERVIVAGETCAPALVRKHFDSLGHAGLFNEYGPTEASVWASVYACSREDSKLGSIPIGTPIANCELRVLDAKKRRVPIGFSGEIYIGGMGVAKGYLDRAEITRERYVTLENGERFYRTGDLGRWNANGMLEFIGRNDHQLKVRGYRVEAEEVEAAIEEHSDVERAIVVSASSPSDQDVSDQEIGRLAELVGTTRFNEVIADVLRLSDAEIAGQLGIELSKNVDEVKNVVRDRFKLALSQIDRDFIAPPRSAQRDWLIRQAMEELSDDLEHLDKIARGFVAGKDHKLESDLRDISQASLKKDEIMEDWQIPIMQAMADYATKSHGDILEIGFGRGVSSRMIQELGVRSHTIVEMNDHSVNAHFKPWREQYADRDIRLRHARWQDVEEELGLFDGIFFHAFPMNEEEFVEYVLNSVTFAEHSFPVMASHLKKGGVYTYMTTEIDSLSRRHQRLLFTHFSEISFHVVPVDVPENTADTWWAQSMVVVKAVK